ncbi:short chain dehydrogenase domain-containing protein [Ditylenchus destructor]|nr:short chain dehydrogenase domain-containing protein [Ditylenchus destructor]
MITVTSVETWKGKKWCSGGRETENGVVFRKYKQFSLLLFLRGFSLAKKKHSTGRRCDLRSSPPPSRRAVFITGCDTGFGRLLALKCARNGIPTYAGCLTKQGEESLTEDSKDCREKVVTVPLDVTSDESVNAAARFVENDITNRNIQLWALVNNAGIFTCYGPDAWTSIDDYRLAMEVNLYGIIRCTHAFLSLLKQSKGRIISPSSVAGRISIPGGGAYSCAKFAVEAYMDSIRLELRPFGITCSILEPGVFRTNLTDNDQMRNRVNKVWDKLSPEIQLEYGEKFKNQFIDLWNSQVGDLASTHLDYVVDSYYHAITAKYPRLRYRYCERTTSRSSYSKKKIGIIITSRHMKLFLKCAVVFIHFLY